MGNGNDPDLIKPLPSCGVIKEPEEQPATRSDAPETSSTGRPGAGRDGVVETPSLRLTGVDATDERESREPHVSGDNNATGDSSHGAGNQSVGGSSTYDNIFSGESQEPSTAQRRGERHSGGEGKAWPPPGGSSTNLLSHNAGVGTIEAQQGDGPKETGDALSKQQETGGEGESGKGDNNLAVLADTSHQELSRVAPSADATATATATTTPAATPMATSSTHCTPEGFKTEIGAAATTGATRTSAADQGAAREFEESSGSLEGDSAHSRWSLPETRGIGGIGAAGGLQEQPAVWAGGIEDASVGTVEQATSSVESGGAGRGEDGESPSRSRVESYDLQQPVADEFMVPFSPDRPSVAGDLPESPDGSLRKPSRGGMSGVAVTSPEKVDPADVTMVGGGEAGAAATPAANAGSAPSALGVASTRAEDVRWDSSGGVRLAARSVLKEFCFSDDDEDEEEEPGGTGRGTAVPEYSSQRTQPAATRPENDSKTDGGSRDFDPDDFDEEQSGSVSAGRARERNQVGSGQRKQRTKGDEGSSDDSFKDIDSGRESGGEPARRRARQEARLNPLGSLPSHRTPIPGGKPGVVNSASATPVAGTWAAPDFAFSSDDDLDIEFSASERSLERPVERRSPSSPVTGRAGKLESEFPA
ncbi:unnamed protein product [Hapterophycus canaliculatus]